MRTLKTCIRPAASFRDIAKKTEDLVAIISVSDFSAYGYIDFIIDQKREVISQLFTTTDR